MIIKDKPFLWICSYSGQPVLCWHHFSPAVLVSSSGSCRFEPLRVVRFHRLQAYQVRLSRLLVLRRLGRVRGCRHWDDGLIHAGGECRMIAKCIECGCDDLHA